jgi:hypothetical protein
MVVLPLRAKTWLRLLVALLALTGMLGPGSMPGAAMGHAHVAAAPDFLVAAATICHSDDGGSDPSPPALIWCDHCPVCAASPALPPVTPTAAVIPPIAVAASQPRFRIVNADLPRGPPKGAARPRAPPFPV